MPKQSPSGPLSDPEGPGSERQKRRRQAPATVFRRGGFPGLAWKGGHHLDLDSSRSSHDHVREPTAVSSIGHAPVDRGLLFPLSQGTKTGQDTRQISLRIKHLDSQAAMGLLKFGFKWQVLAVERTVNSTIVRAKHLKTGREVELLRGPDYGPRQDELKRCLEMELENLLDPALAAYRRQSLDQLGKIGYRF